MTPTWFLISASFAVAATKCEDDKKPEGDLQAQKEEDTQVVMNDEEEDPYDNLPEKDEPTHCSICLTYRQGPCRPYWRKVEACTKDNEVKEDDKKDTKEKEANETGDDSEEDERDPPCLKYMLPWIDCATGFRNLYNLIELDTNYTSGIADLEKEAKETLCWSPAITPPVDWSAWQDYLEANEDWTRAENQEPKRAEKVPLWKTLDQSKDPELVEVQAAVNVTQDNGILECAYAQDQDGNVIGFQYGTKPSDAGKAKEEQEEKAESTVVLKIRILPQRTQTVTIAAAYTQIEEEKQERTDVDSFDSIIFKSQPYSIGKVAKREEK
eukprot:scaffold8569_cov139-Cylindrotheca_fusiformis.AAC.7